MHSLPIIPQQHLQNALGPSYPYVNTIQWEFITTLTGDGDATAFDAEGYPLLHGQRGVGVVICRHDYKLQEYIITSLREGEAVGSGG